MSNVERTKSFNSIVKFLLPKNGDRIISILYVIVFLEIIIIPAVYLINHARATDVSGDITTNTTWSIGDSPYHLTSHLTVKDGATLTIDAGVEVLIDGDYTFSVYNGILDVNGSSGNEVVFKHNSSTSSDSWNGISIKNGSTATIDYATIQYADYGILLENSDLTINDSTIDTNRNGILVLNSGNLTTASNTFSNNIFFALCINPDAGTMSLGSDADVDSVSNNGYDAIGASWGDHDSNNCPSNTCKISQISFAGTDNWTYFFWDWFRINGSDDTLEIDPGVIIKFDNNEELYVENGATLDINGESENPVYMTSCNDDTIGNPDGDTKNDGATSGSSDDWDFIKILNNTTATVDYLELQYADVGFLVERADLQLNDSLIDSNRVGVCLWNNADLTTTSNTFSNNDYFALNINPDAGTLNLGSGADVDSVSGNGYDAIGVSWGDNDTGGCPSDLCKISQRSFAGVDNWTHYFINGFTFRGSDDTTEIDPGVIIKIDGNDWIEVNNGATLDINGENGNPVYITSYNDDTVGNPDGDTRNDGATSGSSDEWQFIKSRDSDTTITADYLEIRYADEALIAENYGSIEVNDSTIDSNRVGINVRSGGNLTTTNNTISNNDYFALNINPDAGTLNLGSGATVDSVSGNGLNAIGIGWGDQDSAGCPSDLCKISQRSFAGINNWNYFFINNFRVNGSGDTLQIDSGVIMKFAGGKYLEAESGAIMDINGLVDDPVYLTSYRNDSIGGDTNNDGSSTFPTEGDWSKLKLEDSGNHSVEYAYIDYAQRGIEFENTSTTTVSNSFVRYCEYGIYLNTSNSPTFSSVNIEDNANYGMYSTNATVISAENLWWGASNGPYDSSDGGQCTSNEGDGDTVRDDVSYNIDYCPYSSNKFNAANVTTDATSDISENTATGNANLTSLDSFFDITEHGHIWSEKSDIRILSIITQYKMNDNAADTDVIDSINSYNGTSVQNTQDITDTGKINSSLTFNGTSDDISISDIPSPELPFTITFWVYPASDSPVGMFDSAPNEGGVLRNYSAGNFEWHSADPSFALGLSANVWQHLAFVIKHDGTNRIIDYYRNGSLVSSNSAVGSGSFAWTGGNIGSINNGSAGWFEGKIDDFRIYQNELTSDEVSYIYDSGSGTEDRLYNLTELGETSSTGAYTSPITGLSASTNYYTRSYIELNDGTLIDGDIDSFTSSAPGSPPSAQASNINGESNIYAGETKDISTIYTDTDGASNLNEMYLRIQNPGGTDIEYYADEGANGSGLAPTHISGNTYVTSITYDRNVNGNDITVTWHITYDWDWIENTDIEYGVKAIDDDTNDSGWDYTDSDYNYENDLTYYGTLSVTGSINGSLSSGDWVQDSETVNWTGIKVVYEGTNDKYPPDSDFDARITDDDSDTWTDTDSSGTNIDIDTTADNALDDDNIHTIDIVSIPSDGSDLSAQSFTIRIDDTTPDIVDVTGDNEGIWQSDESGPNINWTDPESPSDDTFYITNDGSEPTSSNYEYTTTGVTYDLPEQGEGETSIKVRPLNGASTYGTTYSFIIRYDDSNPQIDTLTSSTNPNESNWYSDDTPIFEWETSDAGSGVDGTWRLIDQTETHDASYIITNGTSDSEDDSWISGELANGTWYFHLTVRDNSSRTEYEKFTTNIDDTTPNIIDITGENDNEWQNDDSGPIISWTDPASLSNDTFFITNDGSEPTSSNYEYSTTEATYDLPEQGEGETTIKVRPQNGAGTYGETRSFIIKFDSISPVNVTDFGGLALSTSSVKLTWNNPDEDFDHVLIRKKTSGIPISPSDGTGVYVGSNEEFTDNDLNSGTKYYYTAFVYDLTGNNSSGSAISVTTLSTQQEQEDTDTGEEDGENTSEDGAIEEEQDESLLENLEKEEDGAEEIVIEEDEKSIILIVDDYEIELGSDKNIHVFKGSIVEAQIPLEILQDEDEVKEIKELLLIVGDEIYVMELSQDGEYYTAKFKSPEVDGEYDVFALVKYKDNTHKKINMNIEVDPYGYVYSIIDGEELSISNAKVTLYKFNDNKENIWESDDEDMPNPQYTNNRGEYKFLVEEGFYKIVVEKEGYEKYESEKFEVKNSIIERNIELVKINRDYKIIIIAAIGISLISIIAIILFIKKFKKKK